MKSNRVEYKMDSPSRQGIATDDVYIRLLVAIAEQAVLDYKTVCRKLTQGKRIGNLAMCELINEYYCLREYFDSGCNGAVDGGKYSIAYQVDARLMKEGIDADEARYNANKALQKIGKDRVRTWWNYKTKQMAKERRKK